MRSISRLQRRGCWYRFRCAVPLDLVEIIGCREITKSLRTADYRVARQRLLVASALVDELFLMARESSLSREEVQDLVRTWFRKKLNEDLERRKHSDTSKSASEAHKSSEAGDIIAGLWRDIMARGGAACARAAQELLGKDPFFEDYDFWSLDEEMRRELGHYLARGMIQVCEISAARQRGDYQATITDPFFNDSLPNAQAGQVPIDAGLTLAEAIERFENAPERANLTVKTKDGYRTVFHLTQKLWGEKKPVRSIARADCREYRDLLVRLPPRFRSRFKGKTAQQAADHAEKEGLATLSETAVNSYMNNLSAFFKFMVKEEYVDKNLATELAIRNPVPKHKRRDPLSLEQLQKIFNAPLYTGCKDDEKGYAIVGLEKPRRGRFWVPLLSLWTGMRLTECCQLLVSDVTKKNGVDVVLVREESDDEDVDKRVKTVASERFVPIHPELKKIGFMKYVEAQRSKGEVKLFPDLKPDKKGYYADSVGGWFRRFMKELDADAERRNSFHSFRHNYRDALREANISRERVVALGGWADNGGAQANYGAGLKASTLYDEICKVEYPGLDLKHLYPGGRK